MDPVIEICRRGWEVPPSHRLLNGKGLEAKVFLANLNYSGSGEADLCGIAFHFLSGGQEPLFRWIW